MYTYSWYHWITFFFLYSFAGWIFESTYVSVKEKHLVNRGFLRLPMLPLYGTGAVMLLWLSLPVRDSIILVYLTGVAAATVLEYVTGYVMERLFKMKYWDYSDQKFNLNGYICLSSSVTWGFLTIFLTEVIHQPIAGLVLKLDVRLEAAVDIVVGLAFCADTVMSVKEALDLGRALEAMTKLKAELDELQLQAAHLVVEIEQKLGGLRDGAAELAADMRAEAAGRVADVRAEAVSRVAGMRTEAAERVAGVYAETAERAAGVRDEAAARLLEARDAVALRIRSVNEKRQELTSHMSFYRRHLLKSNPTATSSRFAEALKELRETLDRRHPD